MSLAENQTPGLVCAHHHLYSALARGMPAPPAKPSDFQSILELIWWRLDTALDEDTIYWSAKLGALEALEQGCTAIIDHHESPNAIDGSLSIIAQACREVGVRISTCYGITDRHGPAGASAGLAENERFLKELDSSGASHGYVGVHAAFTCADDTLVAASELAAKYDVGVHIHVAEGANDTWERLIGLTTDKWLLIHGVHLPDDHGLSGTVVHNPRSNMNNAVGFGAPKRFSNRIALGSDGIGATMLDEFRIAFARLRESDVTETPDTTWSWLENGWVLFPEARSDVVTWSYDEMDAWRLAYTTGVKPTEVVIDGNVVMADGELTQVDAAEIKAKAAEAAIRLHKKL